MLSLLTGKWYLKTPSTVTVSPLSLLEMMIPGFSKVIYYIMGYALEFEAHKYSMAVCLY